MFLFSCKYDHDTGTAAIFETILYVLTCDKTNRSPRVTTVASWANSFLLVKTLFPPTHPHTPMVFLEKRAV